MGGDLQNYAVEMASVGTTYRPSFIKIVLLLLLSLLLILLLILFNCKWVLPGGSGNTIRHNKEITHHIK
jgi:hypothetical protein